MSIVGRTISEPVAGCYRNLGRIIPEWLAGCYQILGRMLSEYSANNGKLDYAEFIIQTKEQVSNESKLYIKGKDVTLAYHAGYVLDPVWFMKDPKEMETDSRVTELTQLTGDTIAMTIKFLDGEIKKYQIAISFNTAGNMLIDYKTDDSE